MQNDSSGSFLLANVTSKKMGKVKSGVLNLFTAPPAIPGGVAGGFRMLISFQGFGHGDSTDFKDWTDSFNRIGFRSRQLSGWFFQILDFKQRSFLRIWFFWSFSKDWIWIGSL